MTAWKHIITGLALGCLVFVNGMALPHVVRHSLHHEHHSATTHSSTICFWVCTAGQMEESSSILPPQVFHYLGEIDTLIPLTHSTRISHSSKARAPPSFN